MPASLPGDTPANNLANPSAGSLVTFSLLSGPKGSPLDVRKITGYTNGNPTYANDAANQKPSTGGLSTGLGFGAGSPLRVGDPAVAGQIGPTAPQSIQKAGFTDDYVPGITKPDGTASANSTIMHIGGGRMIQNTGTTAADPGRPFIPSPYTAGWGIGNAGNGGSRDAGAGPAFTGFTMKMVTNPGTAVIANGGTVEAGFVNRIGANLLGSGSTFGSAVAASAAPA